MGAGGKLRILVAHTRYLTRGGEDESTDLEIELLRSQGHDVELYEEFNSEPRSVSEKVGAAGAAIWSAKHYAGISGRIEKFKPDVLHVQNFFPTISPSIYYGAARHDVAVVQAVRNYRLMCASANLFRDGVHCEDCIGKPLRVDALRHGCYRGSRAATAAVVAMQTTHALAGTWRKKVHQYAALTAYVRDRMVADGLPPEKIFIKPNFIPEQTQSLDKRSDAAMSFLYVGRLTEEKGVGKLIDVWRRLVEPPRLVLVGEGPLMGQANEVGANIAFVGRKSHSEVLELMRASAFVTLPAQWAEPFGRVIVEAYSQGVPVIAARVGGIPELVEDGHTGFLYDPSIPEGLHTAVLSAIAQRGRLDAMKQRSLERYRELYTPQRNYAYLMELYDRAISEKRRGRP